MLSDRIHDRQTAGPPDRGKGLALVWAIFGTMICICFAVLAVDVGRYTLAKGEAQTAADAAARYAVAGMIRAATSRTDTAYAQACLAIADEKVDGRSVTLASTDVEVGVWNESARQFNSNATNPNANAVRVTVRAKVGDAGSAPTFAAILTGKPADIVVQSIATASIVSFEFTAPSSGNLWLADAADNTVITNQQGDDWRYDSSGTSSDPKQRPLGVSLSSLGVSPGDTFTMEGMNGWGNNGSGASTYGPDGKLNQMVSQGNSNAATVSATGTRGIANTRAPLSSFIAVFMTDASPESTAEPAPLDFGTTAQRDYASIAPANKQPFFIGDGKRDNGELQTIKVPAGATRIFFGMMDAWQWNDNTGSYTMSLYRGLKVKTVQ
ncbi:MAG: pilus assembly protein TadG-related protein [Tepidisphaeraceae bacterium]